jgi:hypothetical protein
MGLLVYGGPVGFNLTEHLETPRAGAVEPLEPPGYQHLSLCAQLGEAGKSGQPIAGLGGRYARPVGSVKFA